MTTTLLDKAKTAVAQVHRVAGERESKYLTFKLADESHGVEKGTE